MYVKNKRSIVISDMDIS